MRKCLSPDWSAIQKDNDNVHHFTVELSSQQIFDIHVFDDGFMQKLQASVAVAAENDELARLCGLHVFELLGQLAHDHQALKVEVVHDQWFEMASWWKGKGGAEQEDEESKEGEAQSPKSPDSRHHTAEHKGMAAKFNDMVRAVTPLIESHDKRKERKEAEKQRCIDNKARIRLRCTWRPVESGQPVLPPKVNHEDAPVNLGSGDYDYLWYCNRALPVVDFGTIPEAVAKFHNGVCGPSDGPQCLSCQRLQKERRLEVFYDGQQYTFDELTRKNGFDTSRKQWVEAVEAAKRSIRDAPSNDDMAGNAALRDEVVHKEEAEATVCNFPRYILRVGVVSVDHLPYEELSSNKFCVECNVSPVNDHGILRFGKVDDVTPRRTSGVCPKSQRLAFPGTATKVENDIIGRKIGTLLSSYVPIDVIAEVLDVDERCIMQALSSSVIEKSTRRDIAFDEAFFFFIQDPALTTVTIQVYALLNHGHEDAQGKQLRLNAGALLYKEGFREKADRIGLGDNIRISVDLQLFPVVERCRDLPPAAPLELWKNEQLRLQREQGVDVAIWVESASGLRNVDLFHGKSDPFCKVSTKRTTAGTTKKPHELFKTEVIDNDPNPQWGHSPYDKDGHLQFFKVRLDEDLLFSVYDMNELSVGEKLGEVAVSSTRCKTGLYTDLDLGPDNGTLRVKVAPMIDDKPQLPRYTPPPAPTRVRVYIKSAAGLKAVNFFGGSSDPYVLCKLSQKKQFRTKTIWGTLDPVWQKRFRPAHMGQREKVGVRSVRPRPRRTHPDRHGRAAEREVHYGIRGRPLAHSARDAQR